jgi:hypothetical protein
VTEDKFDPPTESARMQAFSAAIEVKMATFDNHKQKLLSILREAYDLGSKAAPFDDAQSWLRLETTAHQYFIQEGAKQEAMSSASREARQRVIGEALKRARSLIDEAMLDEVGDDLFSAWSEKANLPLASVSRNEDGSLAMTSPAGEMFKKAVDCLSDLETAASWAANEAHQGRGRPTGARVLPVGYIETLASQYHTSTGSRPGPSNGPFFRFVCAFLTALGRANISEEYVVRLIREASSWASTHPNEWALSPFTE